MLFHGISDFWTDLLLLVVKGQRRSCVVQWLFQTDSSRWVSFNQELETTLDETDSLQIVVKYGNPVLR